jgi:hypothetical protein
MVSGMHIGMGLIKNEHGVWCARVFRHNMKDALRAAGVQEDLNDAITGHAGGGVGRGYGTKQVLARYGMARVAEAVNKVAYPGLDLSHIRWNSR